MSDEPRTDANQAFEPVDWLRSKLNPPGSARVRVGSVKGVALGNDDHSIFFVVDDLANEVATGAKAHKRFTEHIREFHGFHIFGRSSRPG